MGGNSSKPSIISYEEAVKRSKLSKTRNVVVGWNQNTAKIIGVSLDFPDPLFARSLS